MVDVYVAAGSNVDPLGYLARALDALESQFGRVEISPAYRNCAVGFEGEDFINLVVKLQTGEPVTRVRAQLQHIEALCDRPRDAPKWAARSMDLDILLYGDRVSDEPGLILPRPDLLKRAYMLRPMAELAPQLRHPTAGRTMAELWSSFEGGDHQMTPVTIPRCVRHLPRGSGQ